MAMISCSTAGRPTFIKALAALPRTVLSWSLRVAIKGSIAGVPILASALTA
ncbi:MAG: hypothetical protein ABR912_05375 [Terracidiphilus sp.]|jgi:hypothetical protein